MKCLITVAGRPQEHTITNVKTGLLKGHERGNTDFFFFLWIENLQGEKFNCCEVMGKESGRHKEKEREIWQTSKKEASK